MAEPSRMKMSRLARLPEGRKRPRWLATGVPVVACLAVAVVWAWRANAERGPGDVPQPVVRASVVQPTGLQGNSGGEIVTADHATTSTAQDRSGEAGGEPRPARNENVSTSGPQSKPELAPGSDEAYRQLIVGEWEDEYYGKRFLTVRPDGTGMMEVHPSGIGKALFAAKLVFQLEWSIQDGVVSLKTLGGEPKSKANLVLKMYGDRAVYPVIELTESRLYLQDSDGKTRYDWRRPGQLPTGGDEE